ncbi:hypothetical protein [Chitiniphilus eburneus]|uniref:Uncharacterized protein n=1 Tax=Chitiniphilus eburneus TaxID=2571148 RepID=A0A4V5MPH2_9NEIS|nr:hypothetical protein [Chitiniphilus eburneus]TJZ68628.1 hypothetical protein FAZ21_15590 [Chitiniphilus eburneus]
MGWLIEPKKLLGLSIGVSVGFAILATCAMTLFAGSAATDLIWQTYVFALLVSMAFGALFFVFFGVFVPAFRPARNSLGQMIPMGKPYQDDYDANRH